MENECPVYKTLQILGRKWALLILRDLFEGKKHFNDFLKATPQLTPRVLSSRLAELEENGLVIRKTFTTRPVRVEYSLTSKGRKVKPLLEAMRHFGRCF